MARYRRLERFYKRGEFVGISEEIHLHVLREERAFVVNIFNLSDTRRRIAGSVAIEQLGVAADRWYTRSERWAGFERGRLQVGVELPPWGAQLVECQAV
jgi:predicted transcriptional regulator YheO